MRRFLVVIAVLAACSSQKALSTEEMIGEWQKTDQKLPPISVLITAEGNGLRARLRLSGVERTADVKHEGRTITLDFDNSPDEMDGRFVSKTELDVRMRGGEVYRLRKRP